MNNMDFEMIIENMEAAGCSDEALARVSALHEVGFDREILSCLRKCRCELMDQLHETQRQVDRMDQLIRIAQGN